MIRFLARIALLDAIVFLGAGIAQAQDAAPIVPAGGANPAAIAGPGAGPAADADAPAARTVYVWTSTKGASNSHLGDWGNGAHATSREMTYEGDEVLRLTTRNFYEGARFDLAPPVDLAPYKDTGFIRLRLRFHTDAAAPSTTSGAPAAAPAGAPPAPGFGGLPAAPAGGGGFGGLLNQLVTPPSAATITSPFTRSSAQLGGALPPLGGPGGPGGGLPIGPGGGFPAAPGSPGGAATVPVGPPVEKTKINQLMVTLMLEKGVVSGVVPVDLTKTKPDDDGWFLFVLPIKDMHSTPDAAGDVKRILLTSDEQDSFFLAQLAIVIDVDQMTVSIRQPKDPAGTQIAQLTVKPGVLTLQADVEAGAADPDIFWNFDADNVGNLPPAPNQAAAPAAAGGDAGAPGGGGINPNGGGNPLGGGPAAGGGVPTALAVATGPRIDAHGLIAKFEYPNEEQNYRVEVTVRDRSGKKKPVTASLLVLVRAFEGQ